jgi:hypothetical protein
MKAFILISSILIFACPPAIAQTSFQKTYGGTKADYGNAVRQTRDGGYVIAGTTFSFGAGGADVYIIKTNKFGDTSWTKTIGGANADEGNSVLQTLDGGYLIAGSTNSFGAGNKDIYLIKTDSMGTTIWSKTFGGLADDKTIGYEGCLIQTRDGGYLIAGNTESFGAGFSDVYLIKVNALGDSLWTKTFGGVDEDFANDVKQTIDGGFIISGSTASFSAFSFDFFLIKTDSIGTLVWAKSVNTGTSEEGLSVQQTSDGGYMVAGYITGLFSGYFISMSRFDGNGNILWTNMFNSGDGDCIQQTADRGFIICGEISPSDIFLMKTDSAGTVQWSRSFGGTGLDGAFSVRQTTDKGFIISGYTISYGAGSGDVYLIKTDSAGNSGCYQASISMTPLAKTPSDSTPIPFMASGGKVMTVTSSVAGGAVVKTLCSSKAGLAQASTLQKNDFSIFPNPTINSVTISFSLIQSQSISLKIFDINGRLVSTLADGFFETGENKLLWNAADENGGVYFLQFQSETCGQKN